MFGKNVNIRTKKYGMSVKLSEHNHYKWVTKAILTLLTFTLIACNDDGNNSKKNNVDSEVEKFALNYQNKKHFSLIYQEKPALFSALYYRAKEYEKQYLTPWKNYSHLGVYVFGMVRAYEAIEQLSFAEDENKEIIELASTIKQTLLQGNISTSLESIQNALKNNATFSQHPKLLTFARSISLLNFDAASQIEFDYLRIAIEQPNLTTYNRYKTLYKNYVVESSKWNRPFFSEQIIPNTAIYLIKHKPIELDYSQWMDSLLSVAMVNAGLKNAKEILLMRQSSLIDSDSYTNKTKLAHTERAIGEIASDKQALRSSVKNYQDALRLLKSNHDISIAQANLAGSLSELYAMGDTHSFEPAEKAFEQSILKNTNNAALAKLKADLGRLYTRAVKAGKKDKLTAAEDKLNEVLKSLDTKSLNPTIVQVLQDQGILLMSQKRYEEAIKLFNQGFITWGNIAIKEVSQSEGLSALEYARLTENWYWSLWELGRSEENLKELAETKGHSAALSRINFTNSVWHASSFPLQNARVNENRGKMNEARYRLAKKMLKEDNSKISRSQKEGYRLGATNAYRKSLDLHTSLGNEEDMIRVATALSRVGGSSQFRSERCNPLENPEEWCNVDKSLFDSNLIPESFYWD